MNMRFDLKLSIIPKRLYSIMHYRLAFQKTYDVAPIYFYLCNHNDAYYQTIGEFEDALNIGYPDFTAVLY